MATPLSDFSKGRLSPTSQARIDAINTIPPGFYIDSELHNSIVFKDGDEEYMLTAKIMKRLIQLVQREFPEDSL